MNFVIFKTSQGFKNEKRTFQSSEEKNEFHLKFKNENNSLP